MVMTSAEMAVQHVASEYCRLYDDLQLEDLAALFTESARIRTYIGPDLQEQVDGRDAILAYFTRLMGAIDEMLHLAPGTASTTSERLLMHCLINPIINVEGDVADASFDYLCFGMTSVPFQAVSGGRFLFRRVVRHGSRWLISELDFHVPTAVLASMEGP
jgi:hypothetical protein